MKDKECSVFGMLPPDRKPPQPLDDLFSLLHRLAETRRSSPSFSQPGWPTRPSG